MDVDNIRMKFSADINSPIFDSLTFKESFVPGVIVKYPVQNASIILLPVVH